ncbi:MAG: hypothetical protein NDF52_06645 [archaeon YNP-WB-062]|nr:hypothetical protein [Candidatus Culexarchaeum yellowstonense]
MSFRISKRVKELMDQFKHVNWSEVVRKAITEEIRKQEAILRRDFERARKAALLMDSLRRSVEGWNSVEEIRRWRERK